MADRLARGVCVRCQRPREDRDKRTCADCREQIRTKSLQIRFFRQFFEACFQCGATRHTATVLCKKHRRQKNAGARRLYLEAKRSNRLPGQGPGFS